VSLYFLADTHIVLHWRNNPKTLTKEQLRVLRAGVRQGRPLGVSAFTHIELAILISEGRVRMKETGEQFFAELESNPAFQILPITFQIAAEFASLGHHLRDPADRAIVATARVHRLRLVTSDRRIIDSKLVAIVE
jgi:PIN domain nuclease of toxin-antitoxin system